MQDLNQNYIFLDSQEERQELVARIKQVRHAVRGIIESLPEEQWYEPRYNGLSPAALLGHLNFSDNMGILLIKLAMLGLRPATSHAMLHRVNRVTTRLFSRRLVPISLQSLESNQERITALILEMPMEKFTVQVWNPARQHFTTLEKGLQEFLLHHWQHHLSEMHDVEGITPSQRSDSG